MSLMFCALSALLAIILMLFVFSALFIISSIATTDAYFKAIKLSDTHMLYFSRVHTSNSALAAAVTVECTW